MNENLQRVTRSLGFVLQSRVTMAGSRRETTALRRDSVFASGEQGTWLTIRRSLVIIYHDVYDEHLFVFAAGLSYYFVLSLFPLLVSMAALIPYVPIPHLFEGLLGLMARLVPGDGNEPGAQHRV